MARVTIYRGLEGEIMKATDKALLFRAVDKQTGETIKQEWFPKSQLSSFGGAYDEIDGTFNYILASEWILGQKGLLSAACDPNLIRKTAFQPALAKPYTGTTTADKAARGNLKDDEGQPAWDQAADDYFNQLSQGDNHGD